jgi:hypothetical protein
MIGDLIHHRDTEKERAKQKKYFIYFHIVKEIIFYVFLIQYELLFFLCFYSMLSVSLW